MEAVEVQSARLQGELSTVIQSAAGSSMGPSHGKNVNWLTVWGDTSEAGLAKA
jgi:hypothetical protein